MLDPGELLSHVALFERATSDELAQLTSASFPRRLARGQLLFSEGDRSDHLFIVATGRIKVLVGSERGDQLVLSVLGPGDQLGELSIIDGHPRSATAEALDDATLLCVPADAVRSLLQTAPRVCLAFAEELAERVRHLTGAAADLVFLDLPRRLAKLLVSRAEGDVVDLTQAEVAAQLGATRPPLNRALSGFQRRSWVEVARGRIVLLDRAALADFAGS
jgi:CRP/FNR family cyclic AMP-dependent transcriptional regulator